jgi:Glycosyltransferase family 87
MARARVAGDVTSETGSSSLGHVSARAEPAHSGPRTAGDRATLARRRVILWGGVLLVLSWAVHGWAVVGPGLQTRTGEIKGADYVQFFLLGSLLHHGRADRLYDTEAIAAEAKRRIAAQMEFHPARNPYGPQVALVFEPLAALPFLPSFLLFSVLSALAYAAATWALWRHAPELDRYGAYVLLLAAACPAMLYTLRFGQISTLTLLAPAFAVVMLAADRRFVAGLCLGLLAYKPQLLVVAVPTLLLARDWRCLGGVLTMSAGQLALGWMVAGSAGMQQYVETLRDLARRPDLVMLYPENAHSIRGFLRLLGVPAAWATGITLALIPACAGALARVWRPNGDALMQVGALVTAMLLFSPHLLSYDLLLLVVPIVALVNWAMAHDGDRQARRAIGLAILLYLAPFSSLLARHTHLQLSTLILAATAALMLSLLWRRVPPEPTAA